MKILEKVATDSRLPAYSRVIFSYFCCISNADMINYKKCEELARKIKINPRTFTRNVKILEKYGYIKVFRNPFTTNIYVLKPEESLKKAKSK